MKCLNLRMFHKGAQMCNLAISETSIKISAISDILRISDTLLYLAWISSMNSVYSGLIYQIFLTFKKYLIS